METKRYTFSVGNEVKFTAAVKAIFSNDAAHEGDHIIVEIRAVPRTENDPFSPNYMGAQEGQDAVGHHQQVRFEGHDNWVSGALLEPTHEWNSFDQAMFAQGLDQFFDGLFDAARKGDISYQEIEQRFFPPDMRSRARAAAEEQLALDL